MAQRLPSLTALRTFEAVARLKSFKAAASELNVTTSAVSHQIKQLEVELTCTLMRRGRGGFELTADGQQLAKVVRRSFLRIVDLADKLKSQGQNRITLQVYSTFAVRWLFPRVPKFEELHPDIELSVVTSQADIDLTESTVDACVMIGAPNDDRVDYSYLFRSRVFPVCSTEYLRQHPSLRAPEDLADHTLLQVYPSHDDWRVWLEAVGAKQVDAIGDNRFDSYDLALKMAENGRGVALAIEPFANQDIDAQRLIEIFPDNRVELPRQWYFATLQSRSEEPKITAFREWLLGEAMAIRNHENAALAFKAF